MKYTAEARANRFVTWLDYLARRDGYLNEIEMLYSLRFMNDDKSGRTFSLSYQLPYWCYTLQMDHKTIKTADRTATSVCEELGYQYMSQTVNIVENLAKDVHSKMAVDIQSYTTSELLSTTHVLKAYNEAMRLIVSRRRVLRAVVPLLHALGDVSTFNHNRRQRCPDDALATCNSGTHTHCNTVTTAYHWRRCRTLKACAMYSMRLCRTHRVETGR